MLETSNSVLYRSRYKALWALIRTVAATRQAQVSSPSLFPAVLIFLVAK